MSQIPVADENDPEASDRETERLLESLRSKGYRVGGVQAVFRIGDAPGRVRYMVNGVPLDRDELRALERGRLKLPESPEDSRPRRSASTAPTP